MCELLSALKQFPESKLHHRTGTEQCRPSHGLAAIAAPTQPHTSIADEVSAGVPRKLSCAAGHRTALACRLAKRWCLNS